MDIPKKLKTVKEFQIMPYEIDSMGIVSNINYIKWFEDLRMKFLDTYYPLSELMKDGISPILMHTEIDYKSPLTIFDKPTGTSWVIQMETLRWELYFEISSNGKLNAKGLQKGTFWDINKNRAAKVPDRLISAYNEIIDSESAG